MFFLLTAVQKSDKFFRVMFTNVLPRFLWNTVYFIVCCNWLLSTYRQSYTEMPNGAPTTMIISKHDKDDSDDSFASDEASDLSVQLGMNVSCIH